MSHPNHHLFLSYCREDNKPRNPGGEGWITAFHRRLQDEHKKYSSRPLHIFFDQKEIDPGTDWRTRLAQGLRTSRLFLAFLTPHYIQRENCLWEWEEYLRREHSQARGDDGITPIFFVTPSDLSPADDQTLAAWLDKIKHDFPTHNPTVTAERLDPILKDLARRNRSQSFEFQPWFQRGPELLVELDAADRLAALDKQLALILDTTLARLSPDALRVLHHAAHLAPDFVVMDWLRPFGVPFEVPPLGGESPSKPPKGGTPTAASADPWLGIWRQLHGLRLLTHADEDTAHKAPHVPRVTRIHRLIAAHLHTRRTGQEKDTALNDLGDFLTQRGQPGDAARALGYYERDLQMSEQLLADNPQSAQAARDVASSHVQMYNFHQSTGDTQRADEHGAACFAILDAFAREGRPMDPQMRQLHAQLAPMFAGQ